MKNNKVDLAIKLLIGCLMVALVVIVARSMNERVVERGDSVPPGFSVITAKGAKITAANIGGKALVLHFYASWCEPCQEEAPSINEFAKKVADAGVVVLGVAADRDENSYQRFLKKYDISFETVRDPAADLSASFGTFKYPETYVIDRQGKVVEKFIGEGKWDDDQVKFVKSL